MKLHSTLFLLSFMFVLWSSNAYTQCNGGNPNADFGTDYNAGISIEANINNARRWEENNRGLTANCLGNLVAPPGGWGTLSKTEKALYILQDERISRGALPYEGMEANLNDVAEAHSQWQIDNNKFSHTGDAALGTGSTDNATFAPCYNAFTGSHYTQRINNNPNLNTNTCSQTSSENIGVIGGNQDVVAVIIYGMMYNDLACCTWGHRNNFLSNYTNDYGDAGSEGFIGIGIATSSSYIWPFANNCPTFAAEIITFNTFDPAGNATCNFSPITTLPIDLLSFNGQQKDETIELNWMTASENNNELFAIEHSIDGKEFEEIGYIEGAGTTTEKQYYNFSDERPKIGVNYYRLAQYDFNGKLTFSKVITILYKETSSVAVFPNPAQDEIFVNVDVSSEQKVKFEIYNTTGKLLKVENRDIYTNQYIPIEVSNLDNGLYLLKVNQGTKTQTIRFFKN